MLDPLPYSNVFDRNFELVGNADGDAAFCGAVQFGERQAGQFGRFGEAAGLLDGVLTGGGVQHQQDVVRGAFHFFADGTLDFGQLVHQVDFGVEATGGVNDGHVAVVVDGVLHGFVSDRSGVGFHAFAKKVAPDALRPDFELVHRSGAEGIAGAHHDFFALLFVLPGQFADGGGFADAVDANNHQHIRFLSGRQRKIFDVPGIVFRKDVHDFAAQQFVQFCGVEVFVARHPLRNAVYDFDSRFPAHVGGNEDGFYLIQYFLIHRGFAGNCFG